MLFTAEKLSDFDLLAKDGEIGSVDEFLFDDKTWEIKYLVADTGTWLIDRKVLISPFSFGEPDGITNKFPILLTKEQVENSPTIEVDKPVSKQHQKRLHEYYGWPGYIYAPFPPPKPREVDEEEEAFPGQQERLESEGDPHLRSTDEVEGYHIQAIDGEIGHVEDFVVDPDEWIIRYIIVDTRNFLPGKKVLVSPEWIKSVNWVDENVFVDLYKETIKNCPEYDPSKPITREYETEMFDHYNKPKYWI